MPHLDTEDVLAAMTGRYGDFYGQWTALKLVGGQLRGPCPLHGGQGPNFAVNPETGLWHCFTQCGEGGDVLRFLEKKCGLTFPEALAEAAAFAGVSEGASYISRPRLARIIPDAPPEPPPVFLDIALAEELHQNLMRSAKVQRWLLTHRGLTEETLRRFQVGLLPAHAPNNPQDFWRVTFPVFDRQLRLTNIRKHLFAYKPELTDEKRRELGKTKPWQAGLTADLFPVSVLDGATEALIVEGEADALVASQLGLTALTGTGGAGCWHERWTDLLTGLRRITIFYDGDAVGLAGAEKVAASVQRTVPNVHILGRKFTPWQTFPVQTSPNTKT